MSSCGSIKLVAEQLEKLGCRVGDLKSFVTCVGDLGDDQAGGFQVTGKPHIYLAEESVAKYFTKNDVRKTILHEMIHAFDRCRAEADWGNLLHHACTEVRASNLSGECAFFSELGRGKVLSDVRAHQQKCVKRRAVLSVAANPRCKGKDQAEEAVNYVFERCFRDYAPFEKPK